MSNLRTALTRTVERLSVSAKLKISSEQHFFIESEMALLSECRPKYAQHPVERPDIVREAMYQHLTDARP
jgi:hypothetical protein